MKRLCVLIALTVPLVSAISSAQFEFSPTEVNALSLYEIQFATTNFPQTGYSIELTFPSPIDASTFAGCSVSILSVVEAGALCSETGNVMTITGAFSTDYTRTVSVAILVSDVTNPPSSTTTSSISIRIKDGSSVIESDTNNLDLTVTATPVEMTAFEITPASDLIGGTTSWDFVFTPQADIPTGSSITIDFPYWNEYIGASGSNLDHFLADGTASCTVVSSAGTETPTCTYSTSTLKLTVDSAFSSLATGEVTLTVDNLLNPPSPVALSGFLVAVADSGGGQMESATTSVQVSTANALTEIIVTPSSSEVSDIASYSVQFKVTNPLYSGCIIEIDVPSDVLFDSTISASPDFGFSESTLTTQIVSGSIQISGGFTRYVTSSYFFLTLTSLENPASTKPTADFTIRTMTPNSASIDEGSGSAVTATAGEIQQYNTNLIVEPEVYVIGTETTYTFDFITTHSVVADGYLTVVFPAELDITDRDLDTACTSVGAGLSATSKCRVIGQTLTVINGFPNGMSPGRIQFSIDQVVNSYSTSPSSSFEIRTHPTELAYEVDELLTGVTVTAVTAALQSAGVSLGSLVTGDVTTYTFTIETTTVIPASGYLILEFPSEVLVSDTASAETSCNGLSGFSNAITCSISYPLLTITNGFSIDFSPGTLSFEISSIQNPSSTRRSASFQVTTYDNLDFKIDELSSGITVKCTTANTLQGVTATPASLVNGASTAYTFEVTVQNETPSGLIVKVTPPSTVVFPANPSCDPSTGSTAVTCKIVDTDSVEATVTLSSGSLSSGSTFAFTLNSVQNPPTTEPTTTFAVFTYTGDAFEIDELTTGITVTTTTAATIQDIQITALNTDIAATTEYTIRYVPENAHPVGTTLVISIPGEFTVGTVSCSSAILASALVCSQSGYQITVTDGFDSEISSPLKVDITLTQITNPTTQITTAVWTVDTTVSGYLIDTSNSVTSEFTCTYPCDTCTTLPTTCSSCDLSSLFPYLHSDQCNSDCPSGETDDNTDGVVSCVACTNNCLECSDTTSTCTACDSSGSFPYLYDNSCNANCLSGYYGDSGVCIKCPNPCDECTDASTCTSCTTRDTVPNLGEQTYLESGACVVDCSDGLFEDTGTLTCISCDGDCAKCEGTTSTCTECADSAKYLKEGVCVDTCPSDGTYLIIGSECIKCSDPCLTCEADLNSCLSCSTGNLYGYECVDTCPALTILVGSECQSCSSPCDTCSGTPTTCDTCIDNYLLEGTSCVSSCSSHFYSDGNNCLECDAACEECTGSSTFCTACPVSELLEENTCVTSCTASTHAFNSVTGECEPCESPCLTCSGDPASCVSCPTGMKLYNAECLSQCPSDTTIDTGTACEDCQSPCATCTGTTSTCVTCVASNYLEETSCVSSCSAGYILFNSECLPCDDNCADCSVSTQNCISCGNSEFLLDGICYTQCPAWYVESGSVCVPETATDCSTGCTTEFIENFTCETVCNTVECNYDNGYCVEGGVQCPDGQYVDNSACSACQSPCDLCTSATECISCEIAASGERKLLYGTTCYDTCPTKTFKASDFICEDCDATCAECKTSATLCLSCEPGYKFFSNTCIDACPASTTIDVSDICEDCNINCLTCATTVDECTSCSDDKVLQGTECKYQCDHGYTLTSSDGNVCQACSGCKLCSGETTTCTACDSGEYLQGTDCVTSCSTEYYEGVDTCKSCPTGCASCASATHCTACSTGYLMMSNLCLAECPAGYQDDGAFACEVIPPTECDEGCTPELLGNTECNAVCDTTNCNEDNGYCAHSGDCPAGMYSDGTQCLACSYPCRTCTAPSVCTSCADNPTTEALLVLDVDECVDSCPSGKMTTLAICIDCDASCKECSGSSTTCIECDGTYLYNGSCLVSCPSDTTVANGFVCEDCHPECATCATATNSCTSCNSGDVLQGSTCQAECDDGYTVTTADASTCAACTGDCVTCSGETYLCTSCAAGEFLHGTNCETACPASTTVQVDDLCLDCESPCLECDGAPTTCTACESGYALYKEECLTVCPSGYEDISGECQLMCAEGCTTPMMSNGQCDLACYSASCVYDQGECTINEDCPLGEYFDSALIDCVPCVGDCTTCSSDTYCTGCGKDGSGNQLYWYGGTCYATCPDGTFRNALICEDCTAPCLTCSGSATYCTSCEDSASSAQYILYNNECVASCPSNTALLIGTECFDCEDPCEECAGSVTTCTVCPTGAYLDGDTCVAYCPDGQTTTTLSPTTCVACDANCATCLGTTAFCTSCAADKVLHLNICEDSCPEGYTEIASLPGECTACSSNCKDCDSDINTCTACQDDEELTTANTCQVPTICPDGMTVTADSGGVCLNCVSPCVTCEDDVTNCLSCEDYTVLVGNSCEQCTDPCLTCQNSQTECLSCVEGYFLSLTSCIACDAPCRTCENFSTECTGCHSNYLFSSTTSQCLECASTCLTCSPDTATCTSCATNMFLEGGACLECNANCLECGHSSTFCVACTSSEYLTATNTCAACDANCAECRDSASHCIECATGQTLIDGVCGNCDSQCETCASSFTECATCPTGQDLVDGNCGVCNSECKTCTSDFSTCATCDEGKYLVGGTCLECDTSCLTCEGEYDRCTSCETSSMLFENACVQCDSSCATCENSPTQCTSCQTGKSVILGECLECTNNCETCSGQVSFCVTCATGWYLDAGVCYECESSCETCEDTASNCITCPLGSNLVDNSCERECSSGSFLYNGNCELCDIGCAECYLQATYCTQCNSDDLIYDGSCVEECPTGYYAENGYCEACSFKCVGCSEAPDTCTECDTDYQLVEGECIKICDDGEYYDGSNCQTCSILCETCTGSPTFCLSCTDPEESANSSGVCEVPCDPGTTRTDSSGEICVTCASQCETCETEVDNCLSCTRKDQKLYEGLCLDECPEGITVDLGDTCEPCDSSCLTCETTPYSCTSCPTGQYVYLNSCVDSCPGGFSVAGGICTQCTDIYDCDLGSDSASTAEEEQFNAGAVPFPFSAGSIVTTGGIAVVKGTAVGSTFFPSLVAICSVEAFAAWGMLGFYGPSEEGYFRRLSILNSTGGHFVYEISILTLYCAFAVQLLCNIVFLVFFLQLTAKDKTFHYWKKYHCIAHYLFLSLSLLISLNCSRFYVCGLFNLHCFQAQFAEKRKFYKLLLTFGYLTLFCVCIPALVAEIGLLHFYSISNWMWMSSVDALLLTVILACSLFVSLLQLEKELFNIECLEKTGNESQNIVPFLRFSIEDTLVHFPYYDVKAAVPPGLNLVEVKNAKKHLSNSAQPSRSTSPMPANIQARRRMSFPLECDINIDLDPQLFPAASPQPKAVAEPNSGDPFFKPFEVNESALIDIEQKGEFIVRKKEAKLGLKKAQPPFNAILKPPQRNEFIEVVGFTEEDSEPEEMLVASDSEIDFSKSLSDPANPELVSVYHRPTNSRLVLKKPFDGAIPVNAYNEPLPNAQPIQSKDFYINATLVDETDIRYATLIEKTGRKVRVKRSFRGAEVIEQKEPVSMSLGELITDEAQLGLRFADAQDPEVVVAAYKPTGELVKVTKSFHGAQVVDMKGQPIPGVAAIDQKNFDIAQTEVDQMDLHLATLVHKYTQARVRVRRTFIGGKVTDLLGEAQVQHEELEELESKDDWGSELPARFVRDIYPAHADSYHSDND